MDKVDHIYKRHNLLRHGVRPSRGQTSCMNSNCKSPAATTAAG